jgi:hypothetical protein
MPGRPADFVVLGALAAAEGHVATPANTVALEMSPDYIGSPFYPNNSKVVFPQQVDILDDDSVTALVGGGMLESFAFGGKSPGRPGQSGGKAVEVGAPKAPFKLADAIGISSWTFGLQLENLALGTASSINPAVSYWPVTSSAFPPPEDTMDMKATDGGNYDNSGLLPLLQREAERIVWVASSYQGLNESYPWQSFCSQAAAVEGFDPIQAGVIAQVVDKFGYGAQVSDSGNMLSNNQVFERAGIMSLCCNIWELKQQGKPAVVKFTQNVTKNSWWGIEGGTTVEIILLYLESSAKFNSALPDETQAELKKGEMFPGFPIFSTMVLNPPEIVAYSAPQANLLAALGEYAVLQNKELFESFLS